MNAPPESPERIRELVALYRRTHYDVVLPGGGTATLRVDAATPVEIAAWIDPDAFAVCLTACNPRSQALPEALNLERMAALRRALRGARRLEGRGGIPGEDWDEPSLLVAGLALGAADRLARRFRQNAVLHVARGHGVRLRLYREDWRESLDGDDALEWAPPS